MCLITPDLGGAETERSLGHSSCQLSFRFNKRPFSQRKGQRSDREVTHGPLLASTHSEACTTPIHTCAHSTHTHIHNIQWYMYADIHKHTTDRKGLLNIKSQQLVLRNSKSSFIWQSAHWAEGVPGGPHNSCSRLGCMWQDSRKARAVLQWQLLLRCTEPQVFVLLDARAIYV